MVIDKNALNLNGMWGQTTTLSMKKTVTDEASKDFLGELTGLEASSEPLTRKKNPGEQAEAVEVSEDEMQKKEEKQTFSEAIKAYKDEKLSGLTDEEREKIDEELRKYVNSEGATAEGFQALAKSLLKKYGYKGDIEEAVAGVMSELGKAEDGEISEIQHAYQKGYMASLSSKERFCM